MQRLLLVMVSSFILACGSDQSVSSPESRKQVQDEQAEADLHEHHAAETITSMSSSHAHLGPHFRWTAKRPPRAGDQQQANAILNELRMVLEQYRDYRVAIEDGYEPFLPNVPQPHYHFTSKWRGFKAAFRFNPDEPTSLLYRKTSDGYQLEGAMFTAPKRADEAELDARVPLSVAQWHAHVDICLPPRREAKTANWSRFGPKGSIVTETECDDANGRWFPQLFGWMLHVYPFEDTQEKIWTH
ncbi:MAG: hypothetical protein AB7H03_12650 [Nitrospirales bacterium]